MQTAAAWRCTREVNARNYYGCLSSVLAPVKLRLAPLFRVSRAIPTMIAFVSSFTRLSTVTPRCRNMHWECNNRFGSS